MSAPATPRLASGEAIVWQGAPCWRRIARDVYHLRGVSAYLALLVGLDAYQAWAKHLPLGKALHDSVPLAAIIAVVLINFCGLAWLGARATRFTVTTHRVILAYGIALPATLSIPHARIARLEVAVGRGQVGDIALTLNTHDHMAYLKLWPYARPWRVSHPQPMLRGIAQAGAVAALVTRAIETARVARKDEAAPRLAA